MRFRSAWARLLLLFCFFEGAPLAPVWYRFRLAWARILLLFGWFEGAPQAPWARILLLYGFFEGASQAAIWLGFAWWLFLFLFYPKLSVGNVSRVFVVAASHGKGANLAAVLLFRRRSPSTFCRMACSESCCCSAFSKALPKHFFGWVLPGGSFFLMRSVGNVSRVFLVAVSQCMGANLAAALLFRRRSSGTGLVWFCWVACGESCCCSAFSKAFPKHLLPDGLQRILLLFGFFEGAP